MNYVLNNELPSLHVAGNAVVASFTFSDAVGVPKPLVDFVMKCEDDTPGNEVTLTMPVPISALLDDHIEGNCLYGDSQRFSIDEQALHKRLKKELLMLVATPDSFTYE